MKTTILHITKELEMGGCCREMENLAKLASGNAFSPVLAGLRGDPAYLKALHNQGISAGIIGDNLEGLKNLVGTAGHLAAVCHMSGEQEEELDKILQKLREAGASVIVARNIFGYMYKGRFTDHLDMNFCNSLHTLWRHWQYSNRPSIEQYVTKNRVIYNAVSFNPSLDQLLQERKSYRYELDIPQDALVMGDVCRPDPRKLDLMAGNVFRKFLKTHPGAFFISRSFPDSAAKMLKKELGEHYINLPPVRSDSEMISTYAAMDVFVHMSTMGESFGMAVAEAMRCGLPVIVNETPGILQNNAQCELVEHGVNGYHANDPVSLLYYMKLLADDVEKRRSLGEAGRSKFRKTPFSTACVISQLESEISSIAAARGKPLPEPVTACDRLPSNNVIRDYLSKYGSNYTTEAVPNNIGDRIWMMGINLQRCLWRIKRKLL